MGRNNADFQEAALFHGTVHPFKIGDVVTPMNGDLYAYATTDVDYALDRAKRSLDSYWYRDKRNNPTYNTLGGKQYDEWENENPPKVFQVEPLDSTENTGFANEDKGNVKSTKGFRVIKQVY